MDVIRIRRLKKKKRPSNVFLYQDFDLPKPRRSLLSRFVDLYDRIDPPSVDSVIYRFAEIYGPLLFIFLLFFSPKILVGWFGDIESYFIMLILSPLLASILVSWAPYHYFTSFQYVNFFYSVAIFIFFVIFSTWVVDTNNPGFHVFINVCTIELFNLDISFAFDNVAFVFLFLTSFLICSVSLASWDNTTNFKLFSFLLFILEFLLFLVFSVMDVFVFFMAYESVIVPVFFIIGFWGGRSQRIYAAYMFFYYTFAGSFAMLFSIIYIYMVVGSTSWIVVSNFNFTMFEQLVLFLAFFLGFAAKLPLYPLHSWLPEAHVEAPTSGSMILAGILLKMGGYGVIRWCLGFFPLAFDYFSEFIITISVVSIFYSSFSALQQLDIKRIIAYSSIAHMGYSILGLFTFGVEGVAGFMFLMISHGFISAGLFFCIGVLYDRYGSRSILVYQGLGRYMPVFDSIFFIFCLANLAFPGTAGFPGEFAVLYSTFSFSPLIAFISLAGVFMAGVYTIWMYCRMMMGQVSHKVIIRQFSDITGREFCVFFPILCYVGLLGVFPNYIFGMSFLLSVLFELSWLVIFRCLARIIKEKIIEWVCLLCLGVFFNLSKVKVIELLLNM